MGRENKESTGQNCQQDTRHQSYDTNNGVSDNKPGQRDRCGSAGNPHFSLKLCQEYSNPLSFTGDMKTCSKLCKCPKLPTTLIFTFYFTI